MNQSNLNRPVLQFADDVHTMPHVRYGQRWSLPDGLEVAVLDVVSPRFIGRREDGVRVTGECFDLRKHGRLVVDVPQRTEREMVANTVYREAEFPPEGMTKMAWLAQMVNETEASATHRATRAGLYRFVSQGNGFASWNGALELTWPAPAAAPVELVKSEPVAKRPPVRVGQVWRYGNTHIEWTVLRENRNDVWAVETPNGPYAPICGEMSFLEPDWQLVRDVESPKPALSRKVEVGQVWQREDKNTGVTVAQVEEAWAFMGGGWTIAIRNGEPVSPFWRRVS